MLRTILLLPLLLAGTAVAQGNPLKTWNKEQSSIERDERRFYKEFKSRFSDALDEFNKPVSAAWEKPSDHKEAVYDYAGIEALYKEALGYAEARAAADDALAASGDAKAAAALFATLLKAAKKMDSIEKDLLDSKPDFGRYTFNQEPGCQLYALRALTTRRAAALGKCADVVPFLTGDAWKKAVRADGRKSHRRRVFVLDALRSARSEASLPFLQQALADKTPAVRIAAIEAAAVHEDKARETLGAAWTDGDPAVRRALLETIAPLPSWFGAVLAHAKGSKGVERDLCVRYLAAVSHQTFGHDLERWNAWYGEYKSELEGGKFDPKTIEIDEAKPKPDPDAISFYGVPISCTGVGFAFEGSRTMATPADLDVLKTQWRGQWPGTRRQWEDANPAQQTILMRQFQAAGEKFPADFRWGMVLLIGKCSTKAIGEKKLLGAKKRDVKEGLEMIEKAPQKGWAAPYQGLRAAATLGGKESSAIDTVVLWSTGDPAGGRYMASAAAADAWNRFNRFRRVRVIAIRLGHRKEPAEAFMKSVADASGGVSLWAKEPPKNP